MRRFLAGFALGSVAISPLAAAKEGAIPPLILQPTSRWHLDYADDSCRMARTFGEGEFKSILLIERYQPGDPFFLLIGGKPFRFRSIKAPVVQFGPGGYVSERAPDVGDLGSFAPALMLTQMRLVPSTDSPAGHDSENEVADDESTDVDVFAQHATPEDEASIERLQASVPNAQPVRLELGSMGSAMAAMRQCTDELLTHWGIDLAAHRGLTRRVKPIGNPSSWIEYPTKLMRAGAQGIVQFRLSVDATGKPSQCHIQRSTRPEGFDAAVCASLMRKGRFEPALGADGEPIASFWRETVRFEMAP